MVRFSIFDPRSSILNIPQATTDLHHAAVHFLDFGILDFVIAPIAAAQESLDLRQGVIVLQIMHEMLISDQFRHGQCPFGHLSVATVGKVNLAGGGGLVQGLGESAKTDPGARLSKRLEEAAQPTVVITMFVRLWPGAELLAVIRENNHGVLVSPSYLAEISDRFLGIAERDQITHPLTAGKDANEPAAVFAQVV